MSENNVMDVFLAVKVDQSESDDLTGLLDTLQKISALQSSFTATGGIDLNVEVDQTELENKVEELQRFLEEDFTVGIDENLLLDIKSDTDYIISRLWSVYSPEASEEQMIDRYVNLSKIQDDIITNYTAKLGKKGEAAITTRWGTLSKGKEEMENLVKILSENIARDIAEDTITASTSRGVRLIERMNLGAEDVNAQTLDSLVRIVTGIEAKYQKDITGLKGGSKHTTDELAVGSQAKFLGMINTKDIKKEKLWKSIRGTPFKFDEKMREKMNEAALRGMSDDDMEDLFKKAVKNLDVETQYIEAGQFMPKGFKELLHKKFRAEMADPKEAELAVSKYQVRITPDELQQIKGKLLEALKEDDKTEFKKLMKEDLSKIYTHEKYIDKVIGDFIKVYNENQEDLKDVEFLSVIQEWKTLSATMKQLEDSMKRYGWKYIVSAAATGEGAISPESTVTDAQTKKMLESVQEKREIQAGKTMLSQLLAELMELRKDIGKTDIDTTIQTIKDKMVEIDMKLEQIEKDI